MKKAKPVLFGAGNLKRKKWFVLDFSFQARSNGCLGYSYSAQGHCIDKLVTPWKKNTKMMQTAESPDGKGVLFVPRFRMNLTSPCSIFCDRFSPIIALEWPRKTQFNSSFLCKYFFAGCLYHWNCKFELLALHIHGNFFEFVFFV